MILYKKNFVKKFQAGNTLSTALTTLVPSLVPNIESSVENKKFIRPNFYQPDKLASWLVETNKKFRDEAGNPVWESDPIAQDSIQNLWSNLGYQRDKEDYTIPWSAATVSNLVLALSGGDKERLKNFKPSESHSDYIMDAFKAKKNPNYQYNLYQAEKLNESDEEGNVKHKKLEIGDILFKGRTTSANWSFEDFEKRTKNYPSHTDMITGKGKDSKGYYYTVTGGNRGTSKSELDRMGVDYDYDDATDTPSPGSLGGVFRSSKVYYNPETGELKNKKYKGVLSFNDFHKEQKEMERMDSKPIAEIDTNEEMFLPEIENQEVIDYDYTARFNRKGDLKRKYRK
jgi:hypothetical protein